MNMLAERQDVQPQWRVILRPFDGDESYQTGQVVDVSGWRNEPPLRSLRFLERLQYGDPTPVDCDCGKRWKDSAAMAVGCCVVDAGPLETPVTDGSADAPSGGHISTTSKTHPAFAASATNATKLAGLSPDSETGPDQTPADTPAVSSNSINAEPDGAADG